MPDDIIEEGKDQLEEGKEGAEEGKEGAEGKDDIEILKKELEESKKSYLAVRKDLDEFRKQKELEEKERLEAGMSPEEKTKALESDRIKREKEVEQLKKEVERTKIETRIKDTLRDVELNSIVPREWLESHFITKYKWGYDKDRDIVLCKNYEYDKTIDDVLSDIKTKHKQQFTRIDESPTKRYENESKEKGNEKQPEMSAKEIDDGLQAWVSEIQNEINI